VARAHHLPDLIGCQKLVRYYLRLKQKSGEPSYIGHYRPHKVSGARHNQLLVTASPVQHALDASLRLHIVVSARCRCLLSWISSGAVTFVWRIRLCCGDGWCRRFRCCCSLLRRLQLVGCCLLALLNWHGRRFFWWNTIHNLGQAGVKTGSRRCVILLKTSSGQADWTVWYSAHVLSRLTRGLESALIIDERRVVSDLHLLPGHIKMFKGLCRRGLRGRLRHCRCD